MSEVWRPIDDFPEYEVSSLGRIRSWKRRDPRIMAPFIDRSGYRQVGLSRGGIEIKFKVHRLVAAAFLGPRPPGLQTRHIDGNKGNNAASNLAYGTASENRRDKCLHGTDHNLNKTECPRGHAYDEANTYVSSVGKRHCRECNRIHSAAKRARQRARSSP